jgi:hypothetical protein
MPFEVSTARSLTVAAAVASLALSVVGCSSTKGSASTTTQQPSSTPSTAPASGHGRFTFGGQVRELRDVTCSHPPPGIEPGVGYDVLKAAPVDKAFALVAALIKPSDQQLVQVATYRPGTENGGGLNQTLIYDRDAQIGRDPKLQRSGGAYTIAATGVNPDTKADMPFQLEITCP